MATTTATAIKKENPIKGVMGNVSPGPLRHAIATAPIIADLFQFEELAIGARVVDAIMAATDMDTHATPLLTLRAYISDGVTTKVLIGTEAAPSTIGQTGGVARLDQQEGLGYVIPSAGFYLYVKVVAAPATFAAGTLTAGVTVSSHLVNGA